MTGQTPAEPPPTARLAAAAADLERLQALMQRAGQGEADVGEVQRSVADYWRDHRQALALAAAGVGDEVRGQLLEQLYAWRDQLGQQLGSPRAGGPHPPDASSPGPAAPDGDESR